MSDKETPPEKTTPPDKSDPPDKPPDKRTASTAAADKRSPSAAPPRVTLETQETDSIGTANTADIEQGGFRFYKRRQTDRLMSVIPELEKVTFRWRDINVHTTSSLNTKLKNSCKKKPPRSKQILKQVNGIAYPGELLAIMGASGAGKTTLLNILTYQRTKNLSISGSLYANGEPVHLQVFRQITAYVNQEDLFIGALTVREHLIFRARVCMDYRLSSLQKMARIDEVITDLGLKNCENTVIGIAGRLKGISGGEMKRLSFASEVLTNPSLMFCDEPTSGLDSSMAANVVQVLKRLAEKGKTIVCTIHQPSSDVYTLFDKILLMAQGRVAFIGNLSQANKFFTKVVGPCPTNFNPADFFIQVLAVMPGDEDACRARIKLVCDKFEQESPKSKSKEFPECSSTRLRNLPMKHTASYLSKWGAVLWRAWISFIRDPLLIQLRVLQTILVAALLGLLFYNLQYNDPKGVMNMNSAMYIIMISISLQNAFSVINVFCEELPVFMREYKNKLYPTHVYFMSKTLVELPIFIVIPFIFASITYYLIGLNINGNRFILAMLVHVLAGNVATGFGYLASTVSNGISMALAIGPSVIMPLIIFGGFFLNVESIPFYFVWLSTISWFRHGNEALMIIQWGALNGDDSPLSFPGPLAGMGNPGELILKFYDFREENFMNNIIMLVVLALGYRLLAYLCLTIRTVCMK